MAVNTIARDERFWRQVRRGVGRDDCWVWTGKTIKGGYGDFIISVAGKQVHVVAHRWSWEEENGPIPDGLFVLHRCDNPPCVRPGHLFIGTQQDNMDDQAAKGRRPPAKGEQNKHARLSADDVREIRRLINEEFQSGAAVGRLFGVHAHYAREIAAGEAWSHVPLATPPVVVEPAGVGVGASDPRKALLLAAFKARAGAGKVTSVRELAPGLFSATCFRDQEGPRSPWRRMGRFVLTAGEAGL